MYLFQLHRFVDPAVNYKMSTWGHELSCLIIYIQKSVFKAAFKKTKIKPYTTLFFYETGLLDV